MLLHIFCFLVLTPMILHSADCASYSKISWYAPGFNVTAGRTCSNFQTYIFTSKSGKIFHWNKQQNIKEYSSKHKKPIVKIECPKYSDEGTVVFVDEAGEMSVWMQKNSLMDGPYLEERGFAFGGPVSSVSVSPDNILIATSSQLKLYKTSNLKLLKTFNIPNCESVILNEQNSIIIVGNQRISLINHDTGQVLDSLPAALKFPSLDFMQQKILLTGINPSNNSTTAHQFSIINSYINLKKRYTGFEHMQYCDWDIAQTVSNIFEHSYYENVELNQKILSFSCSTMTNSLAESMVYLISVNQDGTHFIDAYSYMNPVLEWAIYIVAVCCGCCCTILKNGNANARCCREICECLPAFFKVLYENIFWLPTSKNIEELQEKLKK